jgi:hypothetical protein
MLLQCVMVPSYKHVLQLHYKWKVHNRGYLDYCPRCTSHCNVHFGFNIDISCVIFSMLKRLQYIFSFLSHFCYTIQMHLNYIQQDLTNLEKLRLLFSKKFIVMCFHQGLGNLLGSS